MENPSCARPLPRCHFPPCPDRPPCRRAPAPRPAAAAAARDEIVDCGVFLMRYAGSLPSHDPRCTTCAGRRALVPDVASTAPTHAGPLARSVDGVRSTFARYGLLDARVRFLKGFFHETLGPAIERGERRRRRAGERPSPTPTPQPPRRRGDRPPRAHPPRRGHLREHDNGRRAALPPPVARCGLRRGGGGAPTRPRRPMTPPRARAGGIVIVDDYGSFVDCARAIDEYRTKHGITAPLRKVPGDAFAVFWVKE